ncbi:MFS transporter [Streptomyces olivoreticuli]|uniref:MFS transporter n=1 Tax=Streptomyces olivoreticuli TaxID=68246 RepID=UPI00265811FE|nr:MFS transporter [Streptomyces olivoreticuli]WKK24525.1 MFS transporter [Streptomyces olivoreticuli]
MIVQGEGERRTRGHYLAAAGVFAVGMAGTTLPTPLYGLYRERIGFSDLMVTVVFAVYALGVIAALLVAGDFSDVLGRRPVLLAALGLSVLSAVCFLCESGLPLLFLGRLLSGFSAGLFSGAATAAVLELAPPDPRGRAGFAATAANMGGLGCGPLLSGVLAQYAPWPLRLPFLVHIALLVAALAVTRALPETVTRRTPRPRLRPQGMVVPQEVRGAFVPAGLAAFAGFSLLGLFTAVAPSFVSRTLGVHDLAVSGAVVFTVFCSSTAGQFLMGRVGVRRALPAGCLVLTVGMALVASSLLMESLPVLVVGAVVGGLGQGLAFRAALTGVSAVAPDEHRGATISAFFVVAYVGISLPAVGVGALTMALGLRGAGLVFAGCVVLLSAGVGVFLLRRPPRTD